MVGILTGFGINAEGELARAFQAVGESCKFIHLNDLLESPGQIEKYEILAFPGGFSFGDHVGSGTILAHQIKSKLQGELKKFVADGKLIIGICNGFQTLVKIGLLPNIDGTWKNQASLIHNNSGCFIDKWVNLKINRANPSPWLMGLEDFDCPIRHGEGQFILAPELQSGLPEEQIAFRYRDNPNGSFDDIAGITDPSGQVLGLMPHPEAFMRSEQHPFGNQNKRAAGLEIFRNAVNYLH